ncbi:polyprenyl synthetase family protein [Luteimicrobium subarcticum]|uniref:Geranylgeranyl diphosphate synthase type I n=1 Tax=Luteimicrobium subarcticum TaxID=620910 RepID=A0A2M8WRE7_9MICO|nr:polyprenyl synthetase family protein [Luteimicrobium subarcticum]PJI93499.1 geranylgeranyl diphosphate synthase type I [Luteimicrobium subarcticum]
MPGSPALVDRDAVRAGVDRILAQVVETERGRLADLGTDAIVLADSLAAMLSGGKRMRAALCYWSWRAHGGEPEGAGRARALQVGAALELFQAAALFHDDVMDDSDTRRGLPSAHVVHAAAHRSAGWSGDADRYGTSAAILLGDLALVLAGAVFADACDTLPVDARRAARDLFDEMQRVVTTGQFLDVHAQAVAWGDDPALDEDRARGVLRAKSACYSVVHPLQLGAALAGAPADQVEALGAVSLGLGEAFQLRDDLLGVFGDASRTGKPSGDDLREGKRTVLVARALAAGSPADGATVRGALGRRDLTDDDVDTVRGALVRTGAVASVEALITELGDAATAGLAALPLVEPGRGVVLELARLLVERDA